MAVEVHNLTDCRSVRL